MKKFLLLAFVIIVSIANLQAQTAYIHFHTTGTKTGRDIMVTLYAMNSCTGAMYRTKPIPVPLNADYLVTAAYLSVASNWATSMPFPTPWRWTRADVTAPCGITPGTGGAGTSKCMSGNTDGVTLTGIPCAAAHTTDCFETTVSCSSATVGDVIDVQASTGWGGPDLGIFAYLY